MVDISFTISDNPDTRAQQHNSLEKGIPILYDSLILWMGKKKPNLTRGFIHNLDTAFKKAEELGMMEIDFIKKIYNDYIALKPEAWAIAKTPPNY